MNVLSGTEQWGITMAANHRVSRSNNRHSRGRRASGAQVPSPSVSIGRLPATGAVRLTGTTGNAKYVGRVGVVAVALGVGMAVATGYGMGISRWM